MTLQKIGNITIGLTIISVGISTLIRLNSINGFIDILRILVCLCNLMMGILLIFRRTAGFEMAPFSKPYWLGMVVCNIIVFKYSNDLPIISISSFFLLIGASWTVISLCTLGKQFALFPTNPKIVTKGVYRIIRHPIYLGESIIVIACFLSNVRWLNTIALIVFAVFLYMRINLEEQVMEKGYEYDEYQKKVKWKLLPYIW